jgi:hypothetical protein
MEIIGRLVQNAEINIFGTVGVLKVSQILVALAAVDRLFGQGSNVSFLFFDFLRATIFVALLSYPYSFSIDKTLKMWV